MLLCTAKTIINFWKYYYEVCLHGRIILLEMPIFLFVVLPSMVVLKFIMQKQYFTAICCLEYLNNFFLNTWTKHNENSL